MRDKSQIELENIFESQCWGKGFKGKREVLKESNSKLDSKSIESVIDSIVDLIKFGLTEEGDIPQKLLQRVADEEKQGQLIAKIQSAGERVPDQIAHLLAFSDDIEDDDIEIGSDRERYVDELDFSNPDFSRLPPDEDDPDGEGESIELDPSYGYMPSERDEELKRERSS